MLDHSNIDNTIYDIKNPKYWDKNSLYAEMDRVYDICIGCRLCFNLCPSFPSLFNSIDDAGIRKREVAEVEGRVEKEVEKDEFLDLPEASEYGSADDKWVRNAELFLESLLEKEKLSFQTSELSNEGIKS